jgi:hypothetical protein
MAVAGEVEGRPDGVTEIAAATGSIAFRIIGMWRFRGSRTGLYAPPEISISTPLPVDRALITHA